MKTEIISLNQRQAELWEAYVSSAAKAQASGDIQDGKAAGRAWRLWIDQFLTPEQRRQLGGDKVVRL